MRRGCKDIDLRDYKILLPWVWDCILRHYKNRYDFRDLLYEYGVSPEVYAHVLLEHDTTLFADAVVKIAKEAARRIAEHELQLTPIRYKWRRDGSNGKLRRIGNESAWQQIFDSIAVFAASEVWKRRIVWYQVSSIKGRGTLHGAKLIRKWVQDDNRAMRYAKLHKIPYVSKCKDFAITDVTQCFQSARLEIFMALFRRDCANEDLLWLWETLLRSHRVGDYQGFMIGANVSQWGMQYMLSFVYRYAMNLYTERRGKRLQMVTHMLTQMDDMIVMSGNRKNLKSAVRKIIRFAKEKLGLTIKPNWHIKSLDEEPIDMMGFVIHRNGKMTIRSRVFLRGRLMVLRYHRNRKLTIEQARRLSSFKGFFKHTNIWHVKERKNSDEKIDVKTACDYAASVVSRYDRGINNGLLRSRTADGSIHAAT